MTTLVKNQCISFDYARCFITGRNQRIGIVQDITETKVFLLEIYDNSTEFHTFDRSLMTNIRESYNPLQRNSEYHVHSCKICGVTFEDDGFDTCEDCDSK